MASATQKSRSSAAQPQVRPRGRPRKDGRPAGSVPTKVLLDPKTGQVVKRPRGRPSKEFLGQFKEVDISEISEAPQQNLVKPVRGGKSQKADIKVNQQALPHLVSQGAEQDPAAAEAPAVTRPKEQPEAAQPAPAAQPTAALEQTAPPESVARQPEAAAQRPTEPRDHALPVPPDASNQQDLLRLIEYLRGRVEGLQRERDEAQRALADITIEYSKEKEQITEHLNSLRKLVEEDRDNLSEMVERLLTERLSGNGLRQAA
jgi:hypothetical protein